MTTRKYKSPTLAWWLLVLVGFAFRAGNSWQPVHEFMHAQMVMATGGTVISVTHHLTTYRGGDAKAISYFGYGGEVLLYGLFACISKRFGMFGLGAMIRPGFQAFGSTDFARLGYLGHGLHVVVWVTLLTVAVTLTLLRYRVISAQRLASFVDSVQRSRHNP